MIKYGFTLMVVCFCIACQQPANKNTGTVQETPPADTTGKNIPAAMLIIPGEGIGQVKLNADLDSVLAVLGKPDKQDAAMGTQFATWYAGHDTSGYQTNIYSHHNMGGADEAVSHIKLIRITSPAFKTTEDIHTGLTFGAIKIHYALTDKKPATDEKNRFAVYDDIKAGIAFELGADKKCSAIIVHARGDSSATYLNMHP